MFQNNHYLSSNIPSYRLRGQLNDSIDVPICHLNRLTVMFVTSLLLGDTIPCDNGTNIFKMANVETTKLNQCYKIQQTRLTIIRVILRRHVVGSVIFYDPYSSTVFTSSDSHQCYTQVLSCLRIHFTE